MTTLLAVSVPMGDLRSDQASAERGVWQASSRESPELNAHQVPAAEVVIYD